MAFSRRAFIGGMAAVAGGGVVRAAGAPRAGTGAASVVVAMGEAAGTAAALALKAGVTPRALDASALVARLKRQGVFLG